MQKLCKMKYSAEKIVDENQITSTFKSKLRNLQFHIMSNANIHCIFNANLHQNREISKT